MASSYVANYDALHIRKLRMGQHERRRDWLDKAHQHNPRCTYCYRSTILQSPPTSLLAATVDHYLPRALGGADGKKNWRLCCLQCNQTKADLHPDEWMRLLDE